MERRRRVFVLIAVLLAGVLVAAGCAKDDAPQKDPPETSEAPTTEFTSSGGVSLTVVTPGQGATVTSPLVVAGRAPGSWSFEADFPIEVLDADRHSVGEGHATVKGDWMTEDDVDFEGTVEFDPPSSGSGFLVLRKANPSGESERDDAVEVPIRFEP
jgi:ABC-type transport system substrate-binding protein